MSTQDIIYFFLTKDFRTSLWQMDATRIGSIGHINAVSRSKFFKKNDWTEHNKLFRQNFGIKPKERIIFHRDNTFFSDDHNQGLVITDTCVYYIPDNDKPNEKYFFSWESVDDVIFDNGLMTFTFPSGRVFYIPIKYFTKNNPSVEIGHNIAAVFSSMLDYIKASKAAD